MAKKACHSELVSETQNIEAPYELPEGWKWITIGDCCERAFSGKSPKYSKEITPYKIIGQQANQRYGIDLTFIKYGTKEFAEAQQEFYYLQYNDVLLNTLGTGSIGRSGIYKYDERILTDGHPFVFRTEKKYVADLLFYYLRLNEQEIINTANGSTNQKFLSLKSFLRFPIPLPPSLVEQQRIVNRIETMFAKLDQAQEKAQTVLDSFETRKAAILHKAFTGELTANWRKENGVSDDSWEKKKLGDCGTIYGGGTPSTSHKEYWKNGNILWITSKDMKSDVINDSEIHVNMKGVENSSAKYIDKPAVLFVVRSGILRRAFPVCMVNKEFTVNQDLKALVPNDSIMLAYLFYACKANERKILDTCMKSGTTVESINSESLFNFVMNIPSHLEQQEIVRILDTVLEKEFRTKEAAQTVLDQIALLKKSILARAFRGEL